MSGVPKECWGEWVEGARTARMAQLAREQAAQRARVEQQRREAVETRERDDLQQTTARLLDVLAELTRDEHARDQRAATTELARALRAWRPRLGQAKGKQLAKLAADVRQAEADVTAMQRRVRLAHLRDDASSLHSRLAEQMAEIEPRRWTDETGRARADKAVAELRASVAAGGDPEKAIAAAEAAVAEHARAVGRRWAELTAAADRALAEVTQKLDTAGELGYVGRYAETDLARVRAAAAELAARRDRRPDEVPGTGAELCATLDQLCTTTAERARQDAIRAEFAQRVAEALGELGFGTRVDVTSERGEVVATAGSRSIAIELALGDDRTRIAATVEGFPMRREPGPTAEAEFASCDEAHDVLDSLREVLGTLGIATDEWQWDKRPPLRRREKAMRYQRSKPQQRSREQGGR